MFLMLKQSKLHDDIMHLKRFCRWKHREQSRTRAGEGSTCSVPQPHARAAVSVTLLHQNNQRRPPPAESASCVTALVFHIWWRSKAICLPLPPLHPLIHHRPAARSSAALLHSHFKADTLTAATQHTTTDQA